MRTNHRVRRAGFTLVEMAIVISLVGAIMGSVFAVLHTSGNACQVSSTEGRLGTLANEVMDQIKERLRASSLAAIVPALQPPFSSPSIDFQATTGFSGGAPTWGATERIAWQLRPGEVNDGVDNDRDGLVDDGRIVWTQDVGLPTQHTSVWGEGASEYLEDEKSNGTDDNGNGLVDEAGLCFTVDGTSVVVRLTLQARAASGVILTRTVQERVFLRNH